MAKVDRSKLPMPDPPFGGKIGPTYQESTPEWPALPTAPKGAPNVVIILLDDVGFGQVSTFGGPVPTPALDKLADAGLRYNRFHTTAGRFGIDTFGVGCDTGSPMCKDYKPPFAFEGVIGQVDIVLGDPGLSEEEERVMQAKFHAGINY